MTGQDLIEIFTSNSDASTHISQSLKTLGPDFVPATYETFIGRGYENGRISLTSFREIEEAFQLKSEEERRQMLRKNAIGMSAYYQSLVERLEFCSNLSRAQVVGTNEARKMIDGVVKQMLQSVRDNLCQHRSDDRRSYMMKDSLQVAIVGPPNAGKSSLLNTLARRQLAKVSSVAGSTQEVQACKLNIDGFPVVFNDTVGITPETSAKQGLKDTISRMDSVDLKICMLDMSEVYHNKNSAQTINKDVLDAIDSDTLVLINKSDLVNIRIPAPPAKIRFKQTPLSPQGPDVARHAFRGRVPLRTDGDQTGNFVDHGDYGLRMLEDVRLTEKCLQEVRASLFRHVKAIKGGRFWLKVVPDHPMTSKPLGVRMGRGKGAFDHWEAKVPKNTVLCEIGGGVREDIARQAFKSVRARVPGRTEVVVAKKEETEQELSKRIMEASRVRPVGVWVVSCETGHGLDRFLGDFVEILNQRYPEDAKNPDVIPETKRIAIIDNCAAIIEENASASLDLESIKKAMSGLKQLIDSDSVYDTSRYLYHSRFGVLQHNAVMNQLNKTLE